jgi:hypothetical protein
MPSVNDIGEKGELIFNLNISRDYNFRARHLGEKWPTSDFYIELIGPKEHFYFIVQVKATDKGVNSVNKLKVNIPKDKLHKLNEYYCPTYIAGVDVKTEKVYLFPINTKKHKSISGIPISFELDTAKRKKLFEDVKSFWTGTNVKIYKSKFKHKL